MTLNKLVSALSIRPLFKQRIHASNAAVARMLVAIGFYLLAGTLVARAGSFQAHVDYGTGRGPSSVAVGDFNGDGKPDLATANSSAPRERAAGQRRRHLPGARGLRGPAEASRWRWGTSTATASPTWPSANELQRGRVSVLLGNGDGTFQDRTWTTRPAMAPPAVAVGDFNGDGKPDLAVRQLSTATVSVLLGNGDGTFQPPRGLRRRDRPGLGGGGRLQRRRQARPRRRTNQFGSDT